VEGSGEETVEEDPEDELDEFVVVGGVLTTGADSEGVGAAGRKFAQANAVSR
jgi:hypothetical protein